MLQLTPPGDYADLRPAKDGPSAAAGQTAPEGQLQREVLPDGEPLELSAAGRHVGLDGRPQPPAPGRIGGRPAGRADAQGQVQPGHLRRGLRLGLRPAGRGRAEEHRNGPAEARRAAVAGLDRSRQGRCLRPGAVRAEDPGRLYRRRHRHHRRRRSGGLCQAAAADGRGQARHVPRRGRQQQLRAGRAEGHRRARRRVVPRR